MSFSNWTFSGANSSNTDGGRLYYSYVGDTYTNDFSSDFAGWTASGSGFTPQLKNDGNGRGSQYLELAPTSANGNFSRTFTISSGGGTLSFWSSNDGYGTGAGVSHYTVTTSWVFRHNYTANAWTQYSRSLPAGTVTITFFTKAGNYVRLDDISVTNVSTGTPSYTISLYKDAARTQLVAQGSSSTGTITFTQQNSSGLSGSVSHTSPVGLLNGDILAYQTYNFTASGGIAFGGIAVDSQIYNFSETASGGLTFGGIAANSQIYNFIETALGGFAFGGEAANSQTNTYSETALGGITFGGEAVDSQIHNFSETASGGITFGGYADIVQSMLPVPCNEFNYLMSNGLAFGGSATVTSSIVEGGISIAGSALVDVVNISYDGLIAIWPLDEQGNGTADEYQDRGPFGLHGIAGEIAPALASGVFSLNCNYFSETEDLNGSYISLPADNLSSNHTFSVSCWVKIEDLYKPRMIFSRGYQDIDGNEWAFYLGYSYLNHLVASVQMSNGTVYECYSTTMMEQGRFYHVACCFEPASHLKVFIDGSEEATESITESETEAVANGSYLGRFNLGGYPTCYLQEVRLYPDCQIEEYWAAEHDNFCSPSFYSVGFEENPSYS